MGCVSRNLVAINFCYSIARMNASTELSRAIGNEIITAANISAHLL